MKSVEQGYFSIPTGVVSINSDIVPITEMYEKIADSIQPFPKSPQNRMIRLSESQEIPREAINAELVRRHEYAHYRQLMSTPLGLLLWRVNNSLLSNISYVVRAVTCVRPLQKVELPIDIWFRKVGLEQLSKAASEGANFNSRWPYKNVRDLRLALPYLEYVSDEISILKKFTSAILERTDLTVGEFIEIANTSFNILQNRSNTSFDVCWSTRLPLDTPLISHNRFSGSEMIEASARLEERLWLNSFPYSPKTLREIEMWELRAIHGVYAPAYLWLLDQLEDVGVALSIIDTAFMSPIDPAFAEVCSGSLIVEEVLPSFRLEKLVEVALTDFWPATTSELDDFLNQTLCVRAGLPKPSKVISQGLAVSYSGKNSWGYDARSRGEDLFDLSIVLEYSQDEVRRAMSIRERSASAFVRENYEKVGSFSPILTFYRDSVIYGMDTPSYDGRYDELYLKAYWKFISDGLTFSLLKDGDLTDLSRHIRVFNQRAINEWIPRLIRTSPSGAALSEDEKRAKSESFLELLELLPHARGLLGDEYLYLIDL